VRRGRRKGRRMRRVRRGRRGVGRERGRRREGRGEGIIGLIHMTEYRFINYGHAPSLYPPSVCHLV